MAKALADRAGVAAPRRFEPVPMDPGLRLNFKQLRRPTRLPTLAAGSPFGRYLERLQWLFGAS